MQSKFPQIGVSIFATMSQWCRELGAINLAQGCPDFDCDPTLFALVQKYMRQGFNQYSPMEGIFPLRESIAQKIYNSYGVNYNPATEITITAGATEAVYCAIAATVRTGDEVIYFEPAFDSYLPNILMQGGVPVPIALHYPDYKIDWGLVRSKMNKNTRLVIINSPHNPTGMILSKADMDELETLSEEFDFYLLSDEVYEHLVFDDKKHESVAAYENLRKRSFIIYSFGKVFHITGWRLGYCLAPAAMMDAFRKIHQFVNFSAVTPLQYAVQEYMQEPRHYLDLPQFYQQKRDLLIALLKDSRFQLIPSQGTYFQLVSYENISDQNDRQFSELLIREYGVACIPLSPFYHDGKDEKIIRFCFAKKEQTLIDAAKILCKI